MKETAVHDIIEGQVLAEDVTCADTGQVLIAAGVEIKRSHVELLERRGVLTVRVESPEDTSESEGGTPDPAEPDETGEGDPPDDEFADALSRLEHMFEGMDDDPIMRALHAVARGMVESAMRGGDKG